MSTQRAGGGLIDMLVEYIRYRIPPERQADFVPAYARAAKALDAAPECVGYDLSRCVDDSSSHILRIVWTSAEAHLRDFRTGPNFPAFFAEIRPYVNHIEEMRHYTPTEVTSTR
ncbi:quinol monooxygenase YgiN [Micromonospora kangleipakensis]|uniref:Quinol monooxygenase YgiN n=1 Tax=Micromonospora kangleipakensis TaxID=1077942 RepID=A0A4Q8BIG9_9ACTN|nr:antibiotic biosynthesis monooxygenase [Micromonospora kangleipakensis]RZU77325.1 quinol monooxygenase YgiN [Micromonospora kangleipakensis]